MALDDRLLEDRRRLWHDFSRLLFWGVLHAAVILIVVVMFAVNGHTIGTILLSVILVGGSLAVTAAYFRRKEW
jgi:hypothetical protein